MSSSIDNHIDVLLLEIGTQTTTIDAAVVGLGVTLTAEIVSAVADIDAAIALSTSTLVATLGATSATIQNAIAEQTTSLLTAINNIGGDVPIDVNKTYNWRSSQYLVPGYNSGTLVWKNSQFTTPFVNYDFTFNLGYGSSDFIVKFDFIQTGRIGQWVALLYGDKKYSFAIQLN